jgi:uncharacterized transporter YbjL
MKKSKVLLNAIIAYVLVVAASIIYVIVSKEIKQKFYIVSGTLVGSVVITYFLGKNYQKAKQLEYEMMMAANQKKKKKVEKKKDKSWDQVLREAKMKDRRSF